MLKLTNISGLNLRRVSISTILVGLTFFTFASIGGDKNKSKSASLHSNFNPIRTNRGFTLREGITYRGSMILKQEKTSTSISYNSLITYQKGNSIYILPNKYKVPLKPEQSSPKTNLQLLQLKFKLCK